MKQEIAPSALHEITPEIEALLREDTSLLSTWNSLTPIARNEWICWTSMAKQETTREKRRTRMVEDLSKGKKRPCCWPGCPHRNPKAAKFFK